MSTTEIPTFDQFVDELRESIFDADVLFPSRLHDLNDLLPDYVDVVPDTWWREGYDELEAQGHLWDQSGGGMGLFPAARLSADGRLFVREQRAE